MATRLGIWKRLERRRHYVLVEAGPKQAATWRHSGPWSFWKGAMPQLDVPRRPLLAGVDAVG
jgi:hypothetical protein